MADEYALAGILFILILTLYVRRRNFYPVLFLRQFILPRRMFLSLVLRLRRERRNNRRAWIYLRPQHAPEEHKPKGHTQNEHTPKRQYTRRRYTKRTYTEMVYTQRK